VTALRSGAVTLIGKNVVLLSDALDRAAETLARLPSPFTVSDARSPRPPSPSLPWSASIPVESPGLPATACDIPPARLTPTGCRRGLDLARDVYNFSTKHPELPPIVTVMRTVPSAGSMTLPG
jgi:hypothetical protein